MIRINSAQFYPPMAQEDGIEITAFRVARAGPGLRVLEYKNDSQVRPPSRPHLCWSFCWMPCRSSRTISWPKRLRATLMAWTSSGQSPHLSQPPVLHRSLGKKSLRR